MRTAVHARTHVPTAFQACAQALPLLMLGLAPSALLAQDRRRPQADPPALADPSATGAAAEPARFGCGVAAFREHRFAQAFDQFARLADTGHVPAARLALVMLDNSHLLFETDRPRFAQRQQKWRLLVGAIDRRRTPLSDRPPFE
jgi:hypothetical protein